MSRRSGETMIRLADLLMGLGVPAQHVIGAELAFAHVTHDSREVQQGDLFIARRGEAQDGHAYIADALARGAQGVLAERIVQTDKPVRVIDARHTPLLHISGDGIAYVIVRDSQAALEQVAAWWRTQMPVQVIGITGSVGKTSTKEMTAAVLGRRFRVLKSERSLNTDVGMASTLLQLTPEHEKAVLEMGMYQRGEIAHLCDLARPQIGVVTNVGPVHLERLGTMENITAAKAELVEALPPTGVAVLNGDDERVRTMASRTAARVVRFGLTPGLDVWADQVKSRGLDGISFTLHAEPEQARVDCPLLGVHSVQTAMAAAAVALTLGLTLDEVVAALAEAPPQIRLIVRKAAIGATIIDDSYNASPASVTAALRLLGDLEGRRIAVLGDMLELGTAEAEGHREVGRVARHVAHIVVAVGPRGRLIGEEALASGMSPQQVFFAADNRHAIDIVRAVLAPDDFVLVKGSRGMTMEEIVNALI